MGVSEPVQQFRGRIIGIVHRENDVEDKLIMAPEGVRYSAEEIAVAIRIQEQYYQTYVEAYYQ